MSLERNITIRCNSIHLEFESKMIVDESLKYGNTKKYHFFKKSKSRNRRDPYGKKENLVY